MNPSYDKLIKLNPRLNNRSIDDIENLVATINSLGYSWNEAENCFYNDDIGITVRTEGLDLFDSEHFKKAHASWSSKKIAKGLGVVHNYIPKLFIVFLVNLIAGWIFIPLNYWMILNVILIAAIFIVRKTARKKMGIDNIKSHEHPNEDY